MDKKKKYEPPEIDIVLFEPQQTLDSFILTASHPCQDETDGLKTPET